MECAVSHVQYSKVEYCAHDAYRMNQKNCSLAEALDLPSLLYKDFAACNIY